jgi:hypothetical protein
VENVCRRERERGKRESQREEEENVSHTRKERGPILDIKKNEK